MKSVKTINNRRAAYDYHLGDKIVAGLALKGHEVKNIREQRVSLKNAFVNLQDGEAWLKNLQISPLSSAQPPTRDRQKLLLTKAQIKKLQAALSQQYNTLVILRLILGKHIKIEIAPGLGKKKYDKRQSIKQKDSQKKIRQRIKGS